MPRLQRVLLQGGLVASLLAPATPAARASDCVAWAGEPSPLPHVRDRDPLRARWALLRASELSMRAQDLEALEAEAAYQTWRRVLCLDPGDERALAGMQRARPLRVLRPEIRIAAADSPADPDTDVWADLGAPLTIVLRGNAASQRGSGEGSRPGTPPLLEAPVRAESLRRIDRALGSAEAQAEAARFGDSLETLAKARAGLAALPPGRDLSERWLRLEQVAATAEIALGRGDAARACLERVLALDPDFAFDAATTSPKLVRLLDAARAQRGAAR